MTGLNQTIKIYGDGLQIRDWLYVSDHCSALRIVLKKGRPGEHYIIGGDEQITNIALANKICQILDILKPKDDGLSYSSQIKNVADRKGHDKRYAIDASKLKLELGWDKTIPLDMGLKKTIIWYLENMTRLKDENFNHR